MEEKLLKIINHYGVNHQQRKLQEEVFELQEAIINANTFDFIVNDYPEIKDNRIAFIKHITEELADVMVLLEQIKLYYGITSREVTEIFWSKVNRQIGRIENE